MDLNLSPQKSREIYTTNLTLMVCVALDSAFLIKPTWRFCLIL